MWTSSVLWEQFLKVFLRIFQSDEFLDIFIACAMLSLLSDLNSAEKKS